MTTRLATKDDLWAILDIHNEIILTTTAAPRIEPLTVVECAEWFRDHVASNSPIFVAATGAGRIVGWGALNRYHDRPAFRNTADDTICVTAAYRRQGIGKLLLSRVVDAARRLDLRAVLAGIDPANEASIRLHRAFGFEEVGRFKEVGYKFGRRLDLLYLELLLGPAPVTPSA